VSCAGDPWSCTVAALPHWRSGSSLSGRCNVTALTGVVATLPSRGRIIPNNTGVERAVASGEKRFDEILTAAAISSASFKDVVGLSGNRVADPLQNRWIGDAPHKPLEIFWRRREASEEKANS
jgi:hypothetical protein